MMQIIEEGIRAYGVLMLGLFCLVIFYDFWDAHKKGSTPITLQLLRRLRKGC